MIKNNNLEKIIVKSVIVLGVLLSIIQFFYNRSLWDDEASVGLNIINRGYLQLLKPLDYRQLAPVLFLEIEKIFSSIIPHSELGLRIFPLISYLVALYFFYKILKIIQPNNYAFILSLSLFVFNYNFIRYSTEVKQYMTDVTVLTVIYYLILREYKKPEYKYYYFGIAAIVALFLSNISPIILFTAGLYLLYDSFKNEKKNISTLIGVFALIGCTFALNYFLFIYNHPLRQYMIGFWSYSNAFMPLNPMHGEFYKFLFSIFKTLASLLKFDLVDWRIIIGLIFLAIISLVKKGRIDLIILTVTPILLHVFLSGFKFYPFALRLALYTAPLVILLVSFAFNCMVEVLFADFKIERHRILFVAIPVIVILYFWGKFPENRTEIRQGVKFVEANRTKDDKVYLNYWSSTPFLYYNEISKIKTDTNDLIFDKNGGNAKFLLWDKNDSLKYLNDLSTLHGRVWFLYGTLFEGELSQSKIAKDYFSSKGENALKEYHAKYTDVYLFDIKN